MEIGEKTATAAFTSGKKICPMEPHSSEGFTSRKKVGDKSVKTLREAMSAGRSTRMWQQVSDSKFKRAENMDARTQPPPDLPDEPIKIDGEFYPLSIAAHHIIPGKGSLPHSTITRFIWAKKGLIESDIGYDVDGAENGVFLPTHQVMSRRLGEAQKIIIHDEEVVEPLRGMSWEELSQRAKEHEKGAETESQLFLRCYTQQAMHLAKAQFHDAHSNYNTWITDRLNEIDVFLKKKSEGCKKCRNKSGKMSPPYMLVYRLNTLSSTVRNMLKGAPKRKWCTVYTSEFSAMYARSPLPKNQLGRTR